MSSTNLGVVHRLAPSGKPAPHHLVASSDSDYEKTCELDMLPAGLKSDDAGPVRVAAGVALTSRVQQIAEGSVRDGNIRVQLRELEHVDRDSEVLFRSWRIDLQEHEA